MKLSQNCIPTKKSVHKGKLPKPCVDMGHNTDKARITLSGQIMSHAPVVFIYPAKGSVKQTGVMLHKEESGKCLVQKVFCLTRACYGISLIESSIDVSICAQVYSTGVPHLEECQDYFIHWPISQHFLYFFI